LAAEFSSSSPNQNRFKEEAIKKIAHLNALDGFRDGLRRVPDPVHVIRLEQGVTRRALVEQKRRHFLRTFFFVFFSR